MNTYVVRSGELACHVTALTPQDAAAAGAKVLGTICIREELESRTYRCEVEVVGHGLCGFSVQAAPGVEMSKEELLREVRVNRPPWEAPFAGPVYPVAWAGEGG